jgi:DNA-directed RNA polymerase subunit RPC12/RpoP
LPVGFDAAALPWGATKLFECDRCHFHVFVREKPRKQYTDIIGALVRKVKHIAATPGQEKMAA